MNIIEQPEILDRLSIAFPRAFINMRLEFIAYPSINSCFSLKDVVSEISLKCKILQWLSREASESYSRASQKYHLDGINKYLGTAFTRPEIEEIYCYLGNACNPLKCVRFIESGYDMNILKSLDRL